MIKSYKVRLEPNNKQITIFRKSSGVSRWAYNWTLQEEQKYYKETKKFWNETELGKRLTKLKEQTEFQWLNEISRQTIIFGIKDAITAYKNFFSKRSGFPKYKSKKNKSQSFYSRYDKVKFTETHVRLEKIGWIKLSEKKYVPIVNKYSNPRVTFDGLHWYLSVGVEEEVETQELQGILGIDLGVKDTAILSNGSVIPNINKSSKIKKLEARKKRLQKKIAKKYIKNKKGVCYIKTSNIAKLEKKVNKISKKITNVRTDFIHKSTTSIVKTKPAKIVMENLNISGMMKNHKLAKAIQEQSLYEFKRQLQYKCDCNGIELIEADRWYPSSKTCSHCGYIKPTLSLSERIFVCESCGFEIDRDLNAAINLKNYKVA